MTQPPLTIIITRHIAVWFYVITGVAATIAVSWMVRRRLVRLGTRLLALGIAVNASWELLLFIVWTRRYETVVPTIIQAIYHSLTEFAPLLVLAVLVLDWTGNIDLSPWTESEATEIHRVLRRGTGALLFVWAMLCLGVLLVTPDVLTAPVTVYRELTWWYFVIGAAFTIVVLTVAVQRHDQTALMLFVVLGAFNVLFEVVGLVGGYRSYHNLTPVASVCIGLAESGTAATLVWMVATATGPTDQRDLVLSGRSRTP